MRKCIRITVYLQSDPLAVLDNAMLKQTTIAQQHTTDTARNNSAIRYLLKTMSEHHLRCFEGL